MIQNDVRILFLYSGIIGSYLATVAVKQAPLFKLD
jgi:hypothetical protein